MSIVSATTSRLAFLRWTRAFSASANAARWLVEDLRKKEEDSKKWVSDFERHFKEPSHELDGRGILPDTPSDYDSLHLLANTILNVYNMAIQKLPKAYIDTLSQEAAKAFMESTKKVLETYISKHEQQEAADVKQQLMEQKQQILEQQKQLMEQQKLLNKLLDRALSTEPNVDDDLYEKVSGRFEVGQLIKVDKCKGYILRIDRHHVKLKAQDNDEWSTIQVPLRKFADHVIIFEEKLPLSELFPLSPTDAVGA